MEPDAVVYVGSDAVIVEAKLWSGKSSTGEERDQIARQWKSGCDYFIQNSRTTRVNAHVYVTAHLTMPVAELAESLAALAAAGITSPTLMWLSWSSLGPLLSEIPDNLVASDLLGYMREVGVLRFMGWAQSASFPAPTWRYSTEDRGRYWGSLEPPMGGTAWAYGGAGDRYWRTEFPMWTEGWQFKSG